MYYKRMVVKLSGDLIILRIITIILGFINFIVPIPILLIIMIIIIIQIQHTIVVN